MSSQLFSLALGTLGAVIGAPFGMSAVGFSLGSAVGGFLFAPEGPDQEGPRINDLTVTASTLGKTVPEHYGITRSAGNVIWSPGIKEKSHKETVGGGLLGGGTRVETFEYFISFAAAFGRGPAIQVRRIWADGKLIYDVTGEGNVQNGEYNFRFYPGTSSQDLDVLVEESINRRLAGMEDVNDSDEADYRTIDDLIAEATANPDPRSQLYATKLTERKAEASGSIPDYRFTPAYRGLCYIVFEDLPLVDFGNRMPNITAEIEWSGSAVGATPGGIIQKAITEIATDQSIPESGVGIDPATKRLIAVNSTHLRRFDYEALEEAHFASATEGAYLGDVEAILGFVPSGDGGYAIARTTANQLLKVNRDSLQVMGYETFGEGGGPISQSTTIGTAEYGAYVAPIDSGTPPLFLTISPTGQVAVSKVEQVITQVYGATSAFPDDGITLPGDGPVTTVSSGFVYALVENGTNWYLYQLRVLSGLRGEGDVLTVNVSSTLIHSAALAGNTICAALWDSGGGALYVLLSTGSAGILHKMNVTDGGITRTTNLTLPPPDPKSGIQRSEIINGTFAYASGDDVAFVNLTSGTETIYADSLTGISSLAVQYYTGSKNAILAWIGGDPYLILLGRSSGSFTHSLEDVIESICRRAGMTDNEIDVTPLDNDDATVRGYTIDRPATGRQALEKLLMAHFVDGIERDWAVRFDVRSVTPIRTITEKELGSVSSSTGDVDWLESRQPEHDLPAEINITFVDIERDYQQGSAHWRRISNPVPAMYSRSIENIEFPMVFLETEARDIVQGLLFLGWMTRDQGRGMLSWSHIALDPADVIEIEFDDGRTLTERISKEVLGANFEIEIETARSGDPVYTPGSSSPLGSSNVPTIGVQTPAYSKLFVFDIPMLYDYHDTARTAQRWYRSVGAIDTSWRGASYYHSEDGITYSSIGSTSVDVTWGEVTNVLGVPRALWATDRVNTVTVRLSVNKGDLVSVTRDAIINNNANRALIYNEDTGIGEIIQFQTVTDNGDGTVTLSNLTRGVRGTDWTVDGHVIGEKFIFLADAALTADLNQLEDIDTTQYYRAVSVGALLSSAETVDRTWQGRDLMPYAPSRVRRSDDGADLTITWNRRTRVNGEWNMVNSGVETVPLNENSESYEFYLLPNIADPFTPFDPTNTATYKQKQTVTSPTVTIVAADLGTFGYALSDEINVVIYQVSAQVGRGFARRMILAP